MFSTGRVHRVESPNRAAAHASSTALHAHGVRPLWHGDLQAVRVVSTWRSCRGRRSTYIVVLGAAARMVSSRAGLLRPQVKTQRQKAVPSGPRRHARHAHGGSE